MSKHHQQPQKRPEPPPPRDARRPPDGAWWNGIRRLWFVRSEAAPVPLDPQPAPPGLTVEAGAALMADAWEVPVAVKVHL